jgi:prepilin-type N-terminal cleavage/methylation domain-containing protein
LRNCYANLHNALCGNGFRAGMNLALHVGMHTPAFHPPRGRGGFSLPEMLIVLVIMALALAMFVPRLQGVARVSSVQGAMNRLAGDMSLARVRAIRNGVRAQVSIAPNGRSYRVIVDPAGASPDTTTTVDLADEYPGTVLSPAPGTVTFDSRGMLVAGGTTTVTATRETRTASVTISGVGVVYRDF